MEGTRGHENFQKSLEGLWKNRLWTSSCRCLIGVVICVCVCVFSLLVVSDSCDPMDCGPAGFSVHGIFQTRALVRVVISYFRGDLVLSGM